MNLVIEGIDGCGKTSVVAAVVRELNRHQGSYQVRSLLFPDRKTVTGQVIDLHLRSHAGGTGWLDPYTHQSLQIVNRLERLPELLNPGYINVMSRYTPSGYVYGCLDGCDGKWLDRVTAALPPADLNVLLAVSPTTAFKRMRERGVTSDVYERRGVGWFHEAEDLYERYWAQRENTGHLVGYDAGGVTQVFRCAGSKSSWMRVDAMTLTPEQLAEVIARAFLTMFACPCGILHNQALTACAKAKEDING